MTTSEPRSRLRAAVIGCGAIAHEHLGYLGSSPIVELGGVCDLSPALAGFIRDKFRAGAAFTDVREMLDVVRPEVVHVLTPPQSHVHLVEQSLAAGAHVICEKPMAADGPTVRGLIDRALAAGRVLQESRNYLYNDIVLAFTKAVRDGRVGQVLEVDLLLSLDFLKGPFGDENLAGVAVDLPAGAVHDFLPHLAYLFLHFAGWSGDVDAVAGFLQNRSGNRRARFDHLDALIHAGPVRGRLRVTTDVQPDSFRLFVRGTKATLETDLFNPYRRFDGPPYTGKLTSVGQFRFGGQMMKSAARNFIDKVKQHGPYQGMPRMLDAIYRALLKGDEPPFSPAAMIDTARLVDRLAALGSRS